MTLPATESTGAPLSGLAADVRRSLGRRPRELPSRALYDALGSALFDAICHLPWYQVTRAERRLIAAHGADVFRAADFPERVVELGCGNGEKLDLLLGRPGAPGSRVRRVDLVDVSPSALAAASAVLRKGRDLRVVTHARRYEDGLAVAAADRRDGEPVLVCFLGSNIGNFDPPAADALLELVRRSLLPGDSLLIGADLLKPERDLLLAYDDPLGVTAAFNRNLLVRLNRELGADFDLDRFGHRAVWNARESRVEMHLVSLARQRVEVPASGLTLAFDEGETIWTESSYKYRPEDFLAILARAGFASTETWVDGPGQFLLVLARAGTPHGRTPRA